MLAVEDLSRSIDQPFNDKLRHALRRRVRNIPERKTRYGKLHMVKPQLEKLLQMADEVTANCQANLEKLDGQTLDCNQQ